MFMLTFKTEPRQACIFKEAQCCDVLLSAFSASKGTFADKDGISMYNDLTTRISFQSTNLKEFTVKVAPFLQYMNNEISLDNEVVRKSVEKFVHF